MSGQMVCEMGQAMNPEMYSLYTVIESTHSCMTDRIFMIAPHAYTTGIFPWTHPGQNKHGRSLLHSPGTRLTKT